MEMIFEPMVFTRHKLRLHALIIERQAWFSLRDMGRLMGRFFDERVANKLDGDQLRVVRMNYGGEASDVPMINESAVYALLIFHHHPEHRQLRQWLTYQVLPYLYDAPAHFAQNSPTPAVLEWQGGELNVLHWQNEPWIRLRDMPSLLPGRDQLQVRAGNWWRKVKRLWRASTCTF